MFFILCPNFTNYILTQRITSGEIFQKQSLKYKVVRLHIKKKAIS